MQLPPCFCFCVRCFVPEKDLCASVCAAVFVWKMWCKNIRAVLRLPQDKQQANWTSQTMHAFSCLEYCQAAEQGLFCLAVCAQVATNIPYNMIHMRLFCVSHAALNAALMRSQRLSKITYRDLSVSHARRVCKITAGSLRSWWWFPNMICMKWADVNMLCGTL